MQDPFDVHSSVVDTEAIDRAEALDAWLQARLGEAWDELVDGWNGRVVSGLRRKHLYRFHLLANRIARLVVASPGCADPGSRLDALRMHPLEEVWPRSGGGQAAISLVADHPALADDLASAWNSQREGRSLAGWPAAHLRAGFAERFEAALGLLGCAPKLLRLVQDHCAAACILKADPPEERGTCISLTSKSVPGLVYLSDTPLILTAEALVRESASLCLSGWEQVRTFCWEPSRLVVTPFCADPRPVSGLVHQVFVLVRLAELYAALAASQYESVDRNRKQVEKRRGIQQSDMRAGLRALETCSSALTPDGLTLLEALRKRAQERA
jgi:HEXXH motif-containing protein